MKKSLQMLIAVAAIACAGGCDQVPPQERDIIEKLQFIRVRSGTSYVTKKDESMEPRFPYPEDLAFQVRDMNENGRFELTLSYLGADYLVEKTGTNTLRLVPYTKNIEVIRKE